MMLIMLCLERSAIHIIHWIICYYRNVFLLIYEHALVILSSYPSTLHCCIKSHLLWECYTSMFYLLATDLLLLCVIVISFINVAFVCAFVTWIKITYLLTYKAYSAWPKGQQQNVPIKTEQNRTQSATLFNTIWYTKTDIKPWGRIRRQSSRKPEYERRCYVSQSSCTDCFDSSASCRKSKFVFGGNFASFRLWNWGHSEN